MESWKLFLIFVGIILFILIIAAYRKKGKKKPIDSTQTYLSYGDYISAGRLYLREKNELEAAELFFRVPRNMQSSYISMVQQQLGPQEAQLFWIRAGRRFERSAPEKAKIAYLSAGAYFDAIKMFIDQNDTKNIFDLVALIPPKFQLSTVRRLSQYSFNRGKYRISADLLRKAGLIDEAEAILAAGAYDYQSIERPEIAASMYVDVGRQDLVGESQEQRGEQALAEGRIQEAKSAFEEAIKAYDESNKPKDALRIEERLEKFVLLDRFRDFAASSNVTAAEAMIEEISTNFPRIAISDLYAEIAAVLERNNKSSEAVTYYDKAADATNNPLKKQSYVNALRRISSKIATQITTGVSLAPTNMNERCPVCKREILEGQKIVICIHCQKAAHYSHLVEWIKVQGTCPACHKRLKVSDILGS